MLGRGGLLTSTILRPSGGPITRQVLRSLSFSGLGWERSRRVAMALAAAKNMHRTPLALRSMASVQPAKLRVLEGEANLRPRDAKKQAEYLRALVQVDPEKAVKRVESLKYAGGDAVLVEYAKALVHTQQLKHDAEQSASERRGEQREEDERGHQHHHQYQPEHQAMPAGSGAALSLAGGRGKKEPVVVAMAESSFMNQVWGAVRLLAVAYIVLLGVTTFMEEQGLSRNTVSQHDVTRSSKSNKTFKDVVGVDEAKEELVEIVSFLKNPERFTRLGGKMTKGVLLMGPPGTGKTLLAKAIAGEAGVPFFYASGSEFEEMFVGVGARRVRDLFDSAKRKSPCIIFIDEIDAVGATRNPKDQQYMRMTLNQLLSEMDGFHSADGIVVIGATNFPEVLDKALTRPGRFDRHVVVPKPDVKGRTQMLELHSAKVPKAPDVELEIVARGTPGFSGADLMNLVNIAAIKASQEDKTMVGMEEFEFAKDRILMGSERKSALVSEENRKLTAYHEGGHAIVATFTEGALPVHKATVVPRGMALGMVMQLPDKDETSWNMKQMKAEIDVAMGGRVAEELIFGHENVTSGASSDFEHATKIAFDMVEKFGMSDASGYVAFGNNSTQSGGGGSAISDSRRKVIDKEVKKILDESYDRAKKILDKHKDGLHKLAAELLEKETLSGKQVRAVLGAEERKDK